MPSIESKDIAKGGGTIYFDIEGKEATINRIDLKGKGVLTVTIPETVQSNGSNYVVTAITGYSHREEYTETVTDKRKKDYGRAVGTGEYHTVNDPVIHNDQKFGYVVERSWLESHGCVIEEIKLPKTLKKIGEYSFSKLQYLKKINIPEGVEVIENFAFEYCKSLTKITIPSTVKSIGRCAFLCGGELTLEIQNDEGK